MRYDNEVFQFKAGEKIYNDFTLVLTNRRLRLRACAFAASCSGARFDSNNLQMVHFIAPFAKFKPETGQQVSVLNTN